MTQSKRRSTRIDELLKQSPVGENDQVVFLVVAKTREKLRNIRGDLMPDRCNEHVLCPAYPPDMPSSWWHVGVIGGF